jgi:hypothetical protein
MNRSSASLAGVLWALGVTSAAAAQVVSPDLIGAYAPGGDCSREPRVTISDALTVHAAGRSIRLAPMDACHSCAGGAKYTGIEVWVTYLGKDGAPVSPMFRVNADEKRGVLVVDKDGIDQSTPAPVRAVAQASPLRKCAK